MSYQITKLDLIPKGDLPICNVSQFDKGRVLPFEIYENGEAYNIPSGIAVELHCRKADGNVVTLAADTITDNLVIFISTTQLTACYGKNLCEIALLGEDDYLIGSLNFYLEVERDPLLGGLTSSSEIYNLESQIRGIAEDVIPELLPEYLEDYYTKEEVDDMFNNIFPTFTASGAIASFITALNKPLVSVSTSSGANKVIHTSGSSIIAAYFKGVFGGAYGFINLGSLTPTMYNIAAGNLFRYEITDIKRTTASTEVPNDLVYGYTTVSNSARANKTLSQVNNTYGVDLIDNDYSSAEDFKAHMTGIYLIFELETSTTPSISDSQFIELCQSFNISGSVNNIPIVNMPITYSGENNVFSDIGEVNVGYKYMYMPIPESRTTPNRLLLSLVNSDIIKEKTDIIEDIERGDKDE